MSGPDIGQVAERLAAVIGKERRAAISYTLLTVLCTPAFVVLGSLVILFIMAHIFRIAHYNIDARGLYTGFNIFLAGILILMLRYSNSREAPREFDKMWLAAVIVFLLLLFLTHATSLPERIPIQYAVVYTILCLVVLGLLGRVQMEQPERDETSGVGAFLSVFLALFGFIADSYGEITRGSWLWFPPKPDELRLGAWVLCKLAVERTTPLEARSVPRRILNMLSRLKLVQVTDRKLKLTLKGQDLVTADSEIEYTAKEHGHLT